jgi:hypothetical protein
VKKPSLVQIIRDTPPPIRYKQWWEKIDPDVLRELEQVKRAYIAGDLVGWNQQRLFYRVKEELGLTIGPCSFDRYIKHQDAKDAKSKNRKAK